MAPSPGLQPARQPVVGRYAFVVYDEGALLDANVAGSPSTLMSAGTVGVSGGAAYVSTADTVSGRTLIYADKSYESSADLYQLPGSTRQTARFRSKTSSRCETPAASMAQPPPPTDRPISVRSSNMPITASPPSSTTAPHHP